MHKVENFSKIWDNGFISPEALTVEKLGKFKCATGANKVIGCKWTYCGIEHQISFYARPLGDRTGVVHFEHNDFATGRLIVRNGDCSLRVVIAVPRIDDNSRPDKGYLCLPPSPARFGGIEWGCEGNDGYTDYLFDFDWNTGKLLRYARAKRPW